MKVFLVGGVPRSVQQDGWWMSADAPDGPGSSASSISAGKPDESSLRLAVLVALVALADILIWQVSPGISLVAFFVVLLGAGLVLLGKRISPGRICQALLVGLVSVLPLVEQVQTLSVLIAVAGVSLAMVLALLGRDGLVTGVLRFWQMLPLRGLVDAVLGGRSVAREFDMLSAGRRIALRWALPLGFGMAFAGLLVEANPMYESWLHEIELFPVHGPGLGRILFWGGMALLIWPVLVLADLRHRLSLPFGETARLPRELAVVNAAAVARSLVLFNLLFAVQTVLDITYLWGGAALPEGMTYAEYAHRGAYPLVATALLAGVFALMSRPHTGHSRKLRIALLVFVAQNVFLVCSSLFRLDLYVDVYGLTRLRLSAFIWMALVGAGLCLIVWQVLRMHGNGWLMKRLTVLGAATVYGATLFSFDAAIVRHNLTHNVPFDSVYMCQLGPAARPALESFRLQSGQLMCPGLGLPDKPETADWREWGFREWRVLRSLSALETPSAEL